MIQLVGLADVGTGSRLLSTLSSSQLTEIPPEVDKPRLKQSGHFTVHRPPSHTTSVAGSMASGRSRRHSNREPSTTRSEVPPLALKSVRAGGPRCRPATPHPQSQLTGRNHPLHRLRSGLGHNWAEAFRTIQRADPDASAQVSQDVFRQSMGRHGVSLSAQDTSELSNMFKAPAGNINYLQLMKTGFMAADARSARSRPSTASSYGAEDLTYAERAAGNKAVTHPLTARELRQAVSNSVSHFAITMPVAMTDVLVPMLFYVGRSGNPCDANSPRQTGSGPPWSQNEHFSRYVRKDAALGMDSCKSLLVPLEHFVNRCTLTLSRLFTL